MSLKKQLIKLGKVRKNLRPHIRPVLAELKKLASVTVTPKRGLPDSPRFAQHLSGLKSDHHSFQLVEISTESKTVEAAWVTSTRPGRLDVAMGGMVYQFEGRSPEDAAKDWARKYATTRKQANNGLYEKASELARKHVGAIEQGFEKLLKDAKKSLAKQDLEINIFGRNTSWLSYRNHGSDGLLVGGQLKITDNAEYPRSKEEIGDAVVASGVTDWAYVRRGKGAGQWIVEIGNSDRI